MTGAAVTFAVLLPALLVAHNVADHWVQTDHQAANKGLPGWPGRRACAAHVATYTWTTGLVAFCLWQAFDLPVSWWGFVAGQVVSAGSHYWADRRFTLARLCEATGKGAFYRLGTPRNVAAQRMTQRDGRETVGLYLTGPRPHDIYPRTVPWDNPSLGTGAYALDQSWHWFWLLIAAGLTALL